MSTIRKIMPRAIFTLLGWCLAFAIQAEPLQKKPCTQEEAICLFLCDHIPHRSMALFRARAVLDELIAGLPPRSSHAADGGRIPCPSEQYQGMAAALKQAWAISLYISLQPAPAQAEIRAVSNIRCIPDGDPFPKLRVLVDSVLRGMVECIASLYLRCGRPSIVLEFFLRASR